MLECQHDYITGDGACQSCGAVMDGWTPTPRVYSTRPASKSSERTVDADLSKYNFSQEIVDEANDIFRRIGRPTKRGNERKKMVFFLVYTAHRQKNCAVNPQSLGKRMDLEPGDINRALTAFSEVQTGYRPQFQRATPLAALPELCRCLDLEHVIDEVTEVGRDVISKCPSLNEEFPHKVAAGILSYYMDISGIKIDPRTFKNSVDFSDVTIKDIHRRITLIHNQ